MVAKELSRLGRNVELLYQLKRVAETKGVRLITLTGKLIHRTFQNKLCTVFMLGFIESQSQRISDRIKSYQMKSQKWEIHGEYPSL
ncbi:recombinase family protein [Bacillus sp. FSL K6-1005]|uniref:recombinase family protein n=1 Tax=Bacillus sp. FSL K6-1005 TaxID=2954676 RepID=UPI0040489A5C